MKKRKLNSKNPKYKKKPKSTDSKYTKRRVLLQNDGKVTVYGVYFDLKNEKKEILISGNTN